MPTPPGGQTAGLNRQSPAGCRSQATGLRIDSPVIYGRAISGDFARPQNKNLPSVFTLSPLHLVTPSGIIPP